ncbi:MAG: hypothetical protein O3A53_10815 [Acidobacteria bacterium]|nr:hypothetical protein [Acidobacteriota bacterium]
MSPAAELSIVVVATNLVQVTACVDSLMTCAALDRAEIVLVSAVECSPLLARFPQLRIVVASADWSIPRMRAEGLRGVSATWAAVLGEDYRVGADWAEAAVSDREQEDVLVGEVIPPDRGLFAGAIYLWEYLHVAPPAAAGELTREQARWAPAGAVVYQTNGLDIDLIAAARSEMEYHAALFDAGSRFRRDPEMQVRYAPAVDDFLSDRVRRSKEWARLRAASMSLPSRWLVGSSRIGLPIVLVGRFVARAALRPRYLVRALTAFPFTLLFAGAESVGEMQGYFRRTV